MNTCVYFLCESLATKHKLSEVRLKSCVCVCVCVCVCARVCVCVCVPVACPPHDNSVFPPNTCLLVFLSALPPGVCHCCASSIFVTVVCHHSCGSLGRSETNMRTRHWPPDEHLTADLTFICVTLSVALRMLSHTIDVVLNNFSALYLKR